MTISVTQEDIDKGERGFCCWCPVALAIRRTLGDAPARSVEVHSSYVKVGGREIELADPASDFIFAYDRRIWSRVRPFEFELTLPEAK